MGIQKPVVHSDPEILGGTPVFVGTRVPFETLLDYLEGGETLDEFLENFPTVTREQAIAALEQAKEALLAHATSAWWMCPEEAKEWLRRTWRPYRARDGLGWKKEWRARTTSSQLFRYSNHSRSQFYPSTKPTRSSDRAHFDRSP
jgi:uncharacterized protein (DUF433 family)